MARAKVVVTWVLQILCGVLFVLNGIAKFAAEAWERNFERWGYPSGSHLIVGVVEIVAGLGLLVPAVSSYAARVLMVVMVGAAATHAVNGEMRRLTMPLGYLVVLGLIAWLRRNRHRATPHRPLATSPPVA